MRVFKQTNLDKTELLLLYIMKELEADKVPVKLSYNQLQDYLRANRNTTSKGGKRTERTGAIVCYSRAGESFEYLPT